MSLSNLVLSEPLQTAINRAQQRNTPATEAVSTAEHLITQITPQQTVDVLLTLAAFSSNDASALYATQKLIDLAKKDPGIVYCVLGVAFAAVSDKAATLAYRTLQDADFLAAIRAPEG